MKLAFVSAISLLGLAACAAPPSAPMASASSAGAYGAEASATVPAAAPGRQCFRASQVRAHRFADNSTLFLRVGVSDVFRIDTHGRCNNSNDPQQTLVTSTTGGSDIVCAPIDFNLRVRNDGGFITPCFIDRITQLTPAEIAALPRSSRP